MTRARAAAGLAATAIGALVAAELVAAYEVTVGSLDTVTRSVPGAAHHGYALLAAAIAAAPAIAAALRGSRAGAWAVAALGAFALAVALAVGVPDRGSLPESRAYADAALRAGPSRALGVAGGLALCGAAALLLAGGRRRATGEDGARGDGRRP